MKTEVYRWRMSGKMKTELEREARRRGVSISTILETAAREWLRRNPVTVAKAKTQAELHAEAEKYFGVLSGIGSATADKVRETVRRRVRERIERNQRKADSSLRSE
jgi:ribbon-helix-helix CopG family protein